jgi:hypothetical protein
VSLEVTVLITVMRVHADTPPDAADATARAEGAVRSDPRRQASPDLNVARRSASSFTLAAGNVLDYLSHLAGAAAGRGISASSNDSELNEKDLEAGRLLRTATPSQTMQRATPRAGRV